MKRALSLVLAAALVLGSIPAGFAATSTAGETLKGYGVVAGDTNGSLNEDKTITRAEMMTVLARLLGKYEEASKYSIPSTSKDVTGHWNAKVIAFAEKEGWTTGIGNGMFDPQGTVTLQQAATFMLKALGYTVTDFSKVVEEATKLGLLKDVVAKDATAKVLRSDIFTAALNTLNTPAKDATVKLGEKLGYIKPTVVASVVDLSTAKAISFKVVEVKLNAEVKEVKAADFAVTDADGKAFEVKAATVIDSKTVWLDTADQAAGKVYTVKSGEKTAKFTGVAKDSTSPVVQATSKVMDNVTVKVIFDKEVDSRTALVAANYTADNSLQVTKAVWNTDKDGDAIKTEVLLTTSAQTSGTLYKLTVATKVTDLAGNPVKSADDANILKFGGLKADTTLPKLTSAMGKNAVKVVLTFTEASGLDKATAENVANYVLTNKTDAAKTATVTKAELKQDSNDVWNTVELTTTAQTVGNIYEVAVKNVADKFGNVVSATADYKTTFSGQPADTTGPQVSTVEVKTNTSVKVTFNEEVDKTAAETVANYAINNDLTVVKAALDTTKKIVTLTTSTQKSGTAYKITVTNVTDEYANKIGSSNNSGFFSGLSVDDKKPTVVSALSSVDGSKTYVTVTFSEGMNDTAKVASNYFFGDAIGYGVEVTKVSDLVFKVRVNALEDLKNYTVKVTGVEDSSANGIDTDANTANFVGKSTADSDAPKVVGAVAVDKNTIQVLFSRPVKINAANATETPYSLGGGVATADAEDADNYKLVVKGSTTNLITGYANVISYVSKDRKAVTLRFQAGSGVTLEAGKVYEVYVNGAADVTNFAFDAATTALVADNNVTIAKDDSYTTMGSNTADVKQPEIVAAYAINTSTVNIKFNTPIKYNAGAAAGDITIGAINHVPGNTSVSASDNTVLVVKTASALTAGTVYAAKVVTATAVTDIYGDKQAKTTVTQNLTAPSTENDKPAIGAVVVASSSQLEVTLSEDVSTFNKALFTVNAVMPTHVEYKNSTTKNVLNVYFNNTALTAGSVYKLEIAANGLTDMVGQVNTDKLTADFAATGKTLTAVKISDVVKLADNKVRVIFNRPVADTTGAITSADITVAGGATISSLDAAYLAGSKLVAADFDAANEYVDALDFTLNKNIATGTTLTFGFGAGTYVAKDGAALDADSLTKTYTGSITFTAPTVTVTQGVSAVAGANQDSTIAITGPATATASLTIGGVSVAVVNGDTAAQVAAKITTAFAGNTTWTVTNPGAPSANVNFVALAKAANATIAFSAGTTGVTAGAQTDNTAGVATVVAVKEAVTAKFAALAGSPAADVAVKVTFAGGATEVVTVNVKGNATAAQIATAVKDGLAAAAGGNVQSVYTVTISTDTITFTQTAAGAPIADLTITLE